MNYKETLFFIGKCLTITHEKKNYKLVEQQLKEDTVDWDNVVRVSTAHYVFPALYCNLKRVDLLHYLPNDLVAFMEHITHLNREQNLQIIAQAKEINQLLLKHNITPIFLKGTSFLLENLYDDIAERMVGDIDILINKSQLLEANELLKKNGYKATFFELYKDHRHLPRLTKEGSIAAIEIHSEMLIKKFAHHFNYNFIAKTIYTQDNITHLSFENQLNYTSLSNQINDNGKNIKSFSLKNGYDLFLISKKVNSLNAAKTVFKLFPAINAYLSSASLVLNHPESIQYKKDKTTIKHLKHFTELLDQHKYRKFQQKIWKTYFFYSKRISIIFYAFFDKTSRKFIFNRIFNLNWYRQKFSKPTKS